MRASITISTAELRKLVINRINELLPNTTIDPSQIKIEVKSKQNYRSEWEAGEFRATVEINEQEL